jgi:hypothetical protein
MYQLHVALRASKEYIKIDFVPHRKHITSPLRSLAGYCCLGKQSLFIVRTIRNTQIHCVGRMQSVLMLKHVVNIMSTFIKSLKDFLKGHAKQIFPK